MRRAIDVCRTGALEGAEGERSRSSVRAARRTPLLIGFGIVEGGKAEAHRPKGSPWHRSNETRVKIGGGRDVFHALALSPEAHGLVHAGGKVTLNGSDVNPYISQQVSGDVVAIDPTYGLNEGGTTTSGSCSATCTKVSSTSIIGQCCTCNGVNRVFSRAAWNANTYLCQ